MSSKETRTFHINADLFEWSDVIEVINQVVRNNEHIQLFSKLGIKFHNAERIKNVEHVMTEIEKFGCGEKCTAHCYLSFSELSSTFGDHCDNVDVFFWQVIGRTKWIIGEDEYILEPNDVIYVPKKVYHNVIPLSPRVGISFGLAH